MLKELHAAMSDGVTVNMTIVKKGDELIVAVLPKTKADSAYENLPPFTASGNPEEVEKELIEGIMKPIEEFSTSVTGIQEFTAAKKKADEKTAVGKAEKAKEEKAAKKDDKKKPAAKSSSKDDKKPAVKADKLAAEEKPVVESKDPAIVRIEEMLAEGKTAVAMKRGITAKSVSAKILSLVAETPSVVGAPLEDQVKEFVKSVGVLTGEVDMFAEAAPKSEEKPAAVEPAPIAEEVQTPKTEE